MGTVVKAKRIALGSGKLYCIEESESVKLSSNMEISLFRKRETEQYGQSPAETSL